MRFLVILVLFGFAVAASAFLAKVGMRGSVEAELEGKAREALAANGFGGVVVEFDHLEGSLSGTVDRPGDAAKVVALLAQAVPTAKWPGEGETAIAIRPTLPPSLKVVRSGKGGEVRVEGTLSVLEDGGRSLIGSRIHALPGVEKVENVVSLDPMVLPFPKLAEFASLATGLLARDGEVEVSLSQGKLTVAGAVPNEGLKSGLLDLAAQIGASAIEDRVAVVPPVTFARRAEVKLTRNRFGVVLSGVLPSEGDREALLGIFREADPPMAVNDRLETGEHCGPAAWQGSLRELIPLLLARLSGEMTAEFTSDLIRVSGVVPDAAARREVQDRLAALAAGAPPCELATEIRVEGEMAITAVELTAVYEGGLLALSGKLPKPEIVAAIEARIRDKMPEVVVKNGVVAAEAEGAEWAGGLVEFFAESLGRISTGTFVFKDGVLDLEGRTVALPDRQIVQNLAVNLLPPEFKVRNRLLHADQPFPKPDLQPEQRTRLAEALKPLAIFFEKSSDVLEEKEKAKTGAIAEAVKAAGAEVPLVVTGFADNIGDATRNEELSLRRAESVRAELVRLGLPESTLQAASKGEDVSRVSRSELWKSRRVEVSLKPLEPPAPNP